MRRLTILVSAILATVGMATAAIVTMLRTGDDPTATIRPPVAVAGATPVTTGLAGWPNLFGPTHDSRSTDPILTDWPEDGPPESWRIPIGTGYSSPIVVGEQLVLLHRLGDEEVVSCLDAETGEGRWEFRYPTTFVCGSHYTNGPYSTPASDGERVITLGAQGQLHCLRLADGVPLWSRETSEEFDVEPDVFGAGHSPLIWNHRVILNIGGRTGNAGIIAFDPETGDILWQSTDHGPSYATPQPAVIDGRERLFVLTKTGLVMLDPADGRVFFAVPYVSKVADGYSAVTPLVSGNLVLISIFGQGSMCLQIQDDDSYVTVWEDRRTLTSQYNPFLVADGYVYGIHATDTSFRCVDLATGELKWRWKSELRRSTQLIAGGHILLFGEFGELGLLELNPDEPVECAITARSVFDGERCYAAPVLADGRLYLRNEQELVCLDLRPPF